MIQGIGSRSSGFKGSFGLDSSSRSHIFRLLLLKSKRLGLIDGGLGKLSGIGTALVNFVKGYGANDGQDNGKDGNPDCGNGGTPGRLVCGIFSFLLGAALMKLSFYFADAPYGTHWWGSRLLYLGVGFCSVLCIWLGVHLAVVSVTQKVLTCANFSYYNNYMANVLSIDKQIGIIGALCEGSGIRSIERMTGVHRDTIMRLGVKVGQGCTTLLDAKMRNLDCDHLQLDEIWGFIGKKDRNVRPGDDVQLGSVWTFCAIDSDTKLVPSFAIGKRTRATADVFIGDIAGRMKNRVQLSADALGEYVEAIDAEFGGTADFAQIIKSYVRDESHPERQYSPAKIVITEKRRISGDPDMDRASTSYIERLNGTTRLHMRRLTRLTYAFSKKLENFEAAVALHFAYYNLVLRHSTTRCTPAMAAGVESSFWNVGQLVEAATA